MDDLADTFRVDIDGGISDADVARLRLLLDGVSGSGGCAQVPVIAPAMLLGDPAIASHMGGMTAPHGLAVLHESQRFQKSSDTKPRDFAEVEIARQTGDTSARFDFRIWHKDICQAEMTTRLRYVTPAQLRALRGTRFSERLNAPDAVWSQTAALTQTVVADYLTLAHDHNPIHRDTQAAQAAGFDGPVVPGMLLCGLAEFALLGAVPTVRIREMKVRFLAAVGVGEALRIGVMLRPSSQGGQATAARVFAVTKDSLIAAIADVRFDDVALNSA